MIVVILCVTKAKNTISINYHYWHCGKNHYAQKSDVCICSLIVETFCCCRDCEVCCLMVFVLIVFEKDNIPVENKLETLRESNNDLDVCIKFVPAYDHLGW